MDRFRHRDRLLSMKYSTIEACFSVPMLNLTLPSFPFVVAFAVKGLGWQAGAVGFMAALPHVFNCLQPILLAWLSRHFSSFGLLALTFSIGAFPWMLSLLFPILGPWLGPLFVGILLMTTAASSLASVAWSSAISELVPERLSGRYFARRNLVFGAWTLIAVMAAGHLVEWQHNSLTVFAWIFCCAGFLRLFGLFFLNRMKFPEPVMQRRSRAIAIADLLSTVRNTNYLRLCLFVGLWGLLLNAAMPFYTMYVIDRLNLGMGAMVMMTTMASLGGLTSLKAWGALCDRYGNRPVMNAAALIWGLTAFAMWTAARPSWTLHLYAGYFVVGAMTAGFQLAQFNLMIRLAPIDNRAAFVAVFIAITSFFSAIGPILGGGVLRWLPANVATVFGLSFESYHLLFAGTALGGVLVSTLLARVKEPTEQPLQDVWQAMKSMRVFNPMLSILSVGELLLTPRGLVALGSQSLRKVRRQVSLVEEVGGEILEGGRERLFRPMGRKPQDE
jgi:MFS family permease